ncbi:redoxin domain-containing protein [Geodermatophilus normandii]|uniref:Redoxin domain-containing protein n=1 Tax=Geodermatophilus normandii TaxID=1137989 RepID=A0A6P0GG36_9ACTN|nr:redoxin domain-containing protein [Geodermatophilus normandii]NEM06219.1 redoxin domain-containing protein [Geodermatophilus normandii]
MTRTRTGLPVEGTLPSFAGATAWLGSPPLTPEDLRGHVVLVDFWTYTCINWLRTAPWVRAWAEAYADRGLVVVGVHTPEFRVEADPDNVRRAVADLRLGYPVAVDSDYAVWQAFGNSYWPALYAVDAQGRIRYHHFGEGAYEESELVVQALLAEAGAGGPAQELVRVAGEGVEAPADWRHLRSPETHVGSLRAERFSSPGGMVPDLPHEYAFPARLRAQHWALSGRWTVEDESAVLAGEPGRIAYRFSARDLHLAMGPVAGPVRCRVLLDGRPPGAAHGTDVDDDGYGTVDRSRLYQLVRQPGHVGEREFEVEFPDGGVAAQVFTFG